MIGDFLDKTCNLLLQAAPQQDAAGGMVRDPRTVAQDDVPCLVRELSGDNTAIDGKATQTMTVYVYFDPDDLLVEITTKHLIEVIRQPPLANRRLVVTGTINFNTLGQLIRVECLEQRV